MNEEIKAVIRDLRREGVYYWECYYSTTFERFLSNDEWVWASRLMDFGSL